MLDEARFVLAVRPRAAVMAIASTLIALATFLFGFWEIQHVQVGDSMQPLIEAIKTPVSWFLACFATLILFSGLNRSMKMYRTDRKKLFDHL